MNWSSAPLPMSPDGGGLTLLYIQWSSSVCSPPPPRVSPSPLEQHAAEYSATEKQTFYSEAEAKRRLFVLLPASLTSWPQKRSPAVWQRAVRAGISRMVALVYIVRYVCTWFANRDSCTFTGYSSHIWRSHVIFIDFVWNVPYKAWNIAYTNRPPVAWLADSHVITMLCKRRGDKCYYVTGSL
jgi:hypothetical protein